MPLKQALKWMIWSPLFDISAYPEEQRELLTECNRRIDEANSKYRIARFREDMFAKGLKAGMYFCTFDRDENLLGFEFRENPLLKFRFNSRSVWNVKWRSLNEHRTATMWTCHAPDLSGPYRA